MTNHVSRFTTASSSWTIDHDLGKYLREPLTEHVSETHPLPYAGQWQYGVVDGAIEYYMRVHIVGLDAVWSGAVLSIDGVPAPILPRAAKTFIDEKGYVYDGDLFTLLELSLAQDNPPSAEQAVRDAAYRQQLGVADGQPLPKALGSAIGQGRSTDLKPNEKVRLGSRASEW